jgi:rhamnosyltransferase
VVDNGSPEETLAPIAALQERLGFTLVRNGENRGIANAMNVGLAHVLAESYRWVVFFDQDSRVTLGFVAALLTELQDPKVGIACPRYLDKESGGERPEMCVASDGGPLTCMTSGSMSPTDVFRKVGTFVEELFIYCVDDEMCLRVRSAGYTIRRSATAVLVHKEGASKFRSVGGRKFYVTDQKPNRRYYITRNQLWVRAKYPRYFPQQTTKIRNLALLVKGYARTLLLEGRRLAKAVAIGRGICDFMIGRMGKTIEL